MKILIYIIVFIFSCSNLALSNDSLDELLKNEKIDDIDEAMPKINSQDDFIPSSPSDYKKYDNILVHVLDKISYFL